MCGRREQARQAAEPCRQRRILLRGRVDLADGLADQAAALAHVLSSSIDEAVPIESVPSRTALTMRCRLVRIAFIERSSDAADTQPIRPTAHQNRRVTK